MTPERFTEIEARSKLRRRVRTRVEYYRVPPGTTGTVSGIYSVWANGYGVYVAWDIHGKTLSDGFNKSDYEESLEEI